MIFVIDVKKTSTIRLMSWERVVSMMRVLAIETTDVYGSVAVLDETGLIAERPLEDRSARCLAPTIADMLKTVGWTSSDVQGVAVGIGPGSFTGIRVGVVTAKMFAYAVSARIIGVSTLLALAESLGSDNSAKDVGEAGDGVTVESLESGQSIKSMVEDGQGTEAGRGIMVEVGIDAQRGELIAQRFEIRAKKGEGRGVIAIADPRLISVKNWYTEAEHADIVYTGPVLHRLENSIPVSIQLTDRLHWNPRASVIGRIALDRFQKGESDDVWGLKPVYARRSAAEERRDTV
ncbi:MAG: tRNA (adenosine(37)-N6)-threonylcarbamoyltransferase complex dimerization subunit type 1 TsaB [Thermoguttaceae bacterium]